ncbi:MAG: glycosyltransferase family 2 protein [Acidimicrobiia bacterium]|nr:glycosyltransferase family 2 protein [Acidimicrobiia bacterium]
MRVLVAVLVYGGRDYVPRCLESAVRIDRSRHDVDVLVLDDASPDESWSRELASLCHDLGIGSYRSARNLGIPRNMNLALQRGKEAGYDHVVLANSDTVLPDNLVNALVDTAATDDSIGSVTAWSNNVSIFSLRNEDPDRHLAEPRTVDWVSTICHEHFAGRAVDIPVGVGFCLMATVGALRQVGLMDPVFGRGYCEEVDWCLRATEHGLRNVLAPSAFVYHMGGSASSAGAGLLRPGHTTVPLHERIVDLRHPGYRQLVEDHLASRVVERLTDEAAAVLVGRAARERGYTVEASWLDRTHPEDPRVHFTVEPDGSPAQVVGRFAGFEAVVEVEGGSVLKSLEVLVGAPPQVVRVFDRGHPADFLLEEARRASLETVDARSYPERV